MTQRIKSTGKRSIIALSTILFTVACWAVDKGSFAGSSAECLPCHSVGTGGAHVGLACKDCHGNGAGMVSDPAAAVNRAAGCVRCHRGYEAIFAGAMGTRDRERRFVERTFGRHDSGFFGKNCGSCHLSGCLDCHGRDGHRIALPAKETCLGCHKGYFVGVEYLGRAPREENHRYQRGRLHGGEPYLKMLPDVHAEAGLACGACHTMKSLAAGRKSAKGCRDCHVPSRQVVEHRVPAHMKRLECYACHSAWASQEYGTFFLRFVDSPKKELFRLRDRRGEYMRSVYLKKQDAPPLGVNGGGRIAPIRPQFIAYYTEVRGERPEGGENRLLAAEWKAFFPHTVRRETAACDGCHGNPRRFLLENPGERIYLPDQDGMGLRSFWDRTGQRVANGDFLDPSSFLKLSAKSPAYKKGYVEKWKRLTGFEGD